MCQTYLRKGKNVSTRKLWSIRYLFKIAIIVLLLDQIFKNLIIYTPSLKHVRLTCNLNLHLAHNTGAAFGLLGDAGGWQRWMFIAIAVIISITIVTWARRLQKKDKLEILCLGLILGGAIGNLTDRIRFGYVIDFIDFHIGTWHWYTFNIADSAICIGAVLLCIHTLLYSKKR